MIQRLWRAGKRFLLQGGELWCFQHIGADDQDTSKIELLS